MNRPRLRWLPAIVVVVTVLYTISVYPSLPERMATHWGIDGRPNGWSPRVFGAWLLPSIMVLMGLLFAVLPKIDPKKANYDKFGVAYHVLVTAILAFQGVIQYFMLSVAQGHAVDINTVVYVSIGTLFCILGFAMPGGFLMVASGVLTIVAALTSPPSVAFTVFLASSIVASLGSVVLSYFHWRRR